VSTSGVGVRGQSTSGIGIVGVSSSGPAGEFFGDVTVTRTLRTGTLSSGAGIFASSVANTPAVTASGINGASGVQASSDIGLAGEFTGNVSVSGNLSSGTGTFASSVVSTSAITVTATNGATGVSGSSDSGTGIAGHSLGGPGVVGTGGGPGAAAIFGFNDLAGEFSGNVTISGSLSKAGGGFQIDHPLDPAHKYLCHSFIESPEMKNLYDGVVTLDAQGQAEVALPSWFAALNADFRYQLTAIGTAAPNLYIAEEITGCGFKISGGQPGMKVSWQVSAVRQDAWAKAHRIAVEQDKPAKEQGFYLHPELYGQPEQQSVVRVRYPNLPRPAVTR
jgi:hypothetical protein